MLPIPAPDPATPAALAPDLIYLVAESMSRLTAGSLWQYLPGYRSEYCPEYLTSRIRSEILSSGISSGIGSGSADQNVAHSRIL